MMAIAAGSLTNAMAHAWCFLSAFRIARLALSVSAIRSGLADVCHTAANRLRATYLQFTAQKLAYYAQLHRQIFGHEIPQVMVLHANRLNADVIDQVLRVFEKSNYRFVTLGQAQSDPAYQTPERYSTAYGPMWGYRWARTLGVKVAGRREPVVPEWVENYK